MRDDRFLVLALPVPAVQLDAPAAGQQRLAVHLDGTLATELPPGQVRVVGRVDVVMAQRLVHVHVDVEPVQEHGRVLVRHQVPDQSVLGEGFWKKSGERVSVF